MIKCPQLYTFGFLFLYPQYSRKRFLDRQLNRESLELLLYQRVTEDIRGHSTPLGVLDQVLSSLQRCFKFS